MLNRVIGYKDAYEIGKAFYKVFSILSFILAFVSLFVVTVPELIFASVIFNVFFGCIYLSKIVRDVPGMILLVLTNFLYIQLPVVYMCHKGMENNFEAFVSLPNDNLYYYQFLFPGLIYFLFAYICILGGLLLGNKIKFRKNNSAVSFKKSTTTVLWMILGLITFYLITIDNANIFSARAEGTEKQESAIAILFNDKTYQLVFPVLFYYIPHKSQKKAIVSFVVILALFLLLNIGGTSKAALLQVFTFFFLGPLAYCYSSNKQIYWPQKKLLLIGVILAVPLFVYSMLSRSIMGLGISLSLDNMWDLILNSGDFEVQIILELIFERLSAMMNNFLLLFSTFSKGYSLDYSLHFLGYTYSSLMNLVLPGTPFPDAYVLSSQLFPKVVDMQVMESGLDRITYLQQSNTQPYSFFGVLLVIFSPIPALFICFFVGVMFSIFFNLVKPHYAKIVIMYFFTILFQCFGIEAVIQFFIITLVTTFFQVTLMKVFDKLKLN